MARNPVFPEANQLGCYRLKRPSRDRAAEAHGRGAGSPQQRAEVLAMLCGSRFSICAATSDRRAKQLCGELGLGEIARFIASGSGR